MSLSLSDHDALDGDDTKNAAILQALQLLLKTLPPDAPHNALSFANLFTVSVYWSMDGGNVFTCLRCSFKYIREVRSAVFLELMKNLNKGAMISTHTNECYWRRIERVLLTAY
jgi:hypothetical protein